MGTGLTWELHLIGGLATILVIGRVLSTELEVEVLLVLTIALLLNTLGATRTSRIVLLLELLHKLRGVVLLVLLLLLLHAKVLLEVRLLLLVELFQLRLLLAELLESAVLADGLLIDTASVRVVVLVKLLKLVLAVFSSRRAITGKLVEVWLFSEWLA